MNFKLERLRAPRRSAGGHRAAFARHRGGREASGAARRDRLGQNLHRGQGDRAREPACPGARAQQDAGGAALQRVQKFLSAERGRVFRQLLRLLPAGSLHARLGHLHRERIHDQRRAGQAAHERDAFALRAPRRDRGRVGLLHLRHRLARSVLRHAADARKGAEHHSRSDAAQARGHAVRARRRFAPRHVPRARRRLEIYPPYEDNAFRIELWGDQVDAIRTDRSAHRRSARRTACRG